MTRNDKKLKQARSKNFEAITRKTLRAASVTSKIMVVSKLYTILFELNLGAACMYKK